MLKNDCDNGNDYKGTNWASHIKHEHVVFQTFGQTSY